MVVGKPMKKVILLLIITGCLCFYHGCDVSRFKDFDVASSDFDANVFPLNPQWGKQREQGMIPNPSESCPIYSDNEDPNEWTRSPQYPNCTSYVVTFNGAVPCGAHVNFMPVTYEGNVFWVEHRPPFLDDEYTLNVARSDQHLYDSIANAVHIEFDSDETVDNWDDTHTWWDNFHHNAVDHTSEITNPDGTHTIVADGKQYASAMIDGSFVIVIGLLGLDANHDGKAELHPVYAMFVRLNSNDTRQSSWAFFVRNWGDEGFCGDNQEYLYTRQNTVKVKIPNVTAVTADNMWDGAQNDDNLSPMNVTSQPFEDGLLLTFTLLPPEKQSWFVGDLTCTTRSPVTSVGGDNGVATIQRSPNDDDNNPTIADLESRIKKLPDNLKKELYTQLQKRQTRKSFPVKPKMLTEAAEVEEMHHKSPVKVAVKSDLVRRVPDTTAKANRQNKIELAEKYLREKGL